jgi:hypothetical protein
VKPAIDVLGVYRVELGDELLTEALELKYPTPQGSARQEAERHVREEIGSAVLIEVLVRNRDAEFDVGDFGQPNSDQAPYAETYLSEDGTSVISSGYDVPSSEPLRIAFFLHYYDPTLTLRSTYGVLETPALERMPQRLAELVPYEPVD